jgi:hypothetical protein
MPSTLAVMVVVAEPPPSHLLSLPPFVSAVCWHDTIERWTFGPAQCTHVEPCPVVTRREESSANPLDGGWVGALTRDASPTWDLLPQN